MELEVLQQMGEELHRRGLRYLRCGRQGEIFIQRFLLFGYGKLDTPEYALPNFILHHWEELIDDLWPHDHGRKTESYILHGGYDEKIWLPDGRIEERIRRPGSVTTLEFDQKHKLSNILPDTWTIFMVGPMVREYHMYSEDGVLTRQDVWSADKQGLAGVHLDTPELRKRIARRKVAAQRLANQKD
jgi:hypothetical protein